MRIFILAPTEDWVGLNPSARKFCSPERAPLPGLQDHDAATKGGSGIAARLMVDMVSRLAHIARICHVA
jgi:hypothetical protein